MPTEKEIKDRLAEIRGRSPEFVEALIASIFFDDSEAVYMAKDDAENWSFLEFVYVIPMNCTSYNSMVARGYWAQTSMFELPVVLID